MGRTVYYHIPRTTLAKAEKIDSEYLREREVHVTISDKHCNGRTARRYEGMTPRRHTDMIARRHVDNPRYKTAQNAAGSSGAKRRWMERPERNGVMRKRERKKRDKEKSLEECAEGAKVGKQSRPRRKRPQLPVGYRTAICTLHLLELVR